ncbi:hypothetical protein CAPTEDRAFT_208371 [Capitella teleta]|uniref:NWD1/2-like winged helix-turn-helix domain-containing protein n=1 Tax=Capitella teleta TaxID=283909 RepID=R7TMM5_CAPTE|nr:hypothetical protein CAPTEDRAFT_208371 [Capitella teleta]|eukprot:ELT94787.1 hypothetical protein CAPTEDRAFT_208371 [Capitella teleta]
MDYSNRGGRKHIRSQFQSKDVAKKTVLPPLLCVKEHTAPSIHAVRLARRSRSLIASQHITENHDYHWNLQLPKRLSDNLDGRIVKHLRKKLNRRLEKRIIALMGDELNERQHKEPSSGIDQAANEEGEGDDHKIILLRNTSMLSDIRDGGFDEQDCSDLPGIAESGTTGKGMSILPAIKRPSLSIHDEVYNSLNEVSKPQRRSKSGRVPESPSPTSRSRPQSIMMNNAQHDSNFLLGNVASKCVPDEKVIFFYLQSCQSDMEAERGALLARGHPRVKAFALAYGYDIRIMDPHWGTRDMVSDDHSIYSLLLSLIDQSIGMKTQTINMVTLLGQKYGEPMPLETIPKEEFEKINKVLEAEIATSRAQTALIEQEEVEEGAKKLWLSKRGKEKSITEDVYEPEKAKGKKTPNSRPATKSSKSKGAKSGKGENTETSPATPSVFSRGADKVKLTASVLRKGTSKDNVAVQLVSQDHTLLHSWFALDENSVPPVYRLKKISSHHKEILMADPMKRSQAKGIWLQTARRLQTILHTCAKKVLDDSEAVKYEMSFAELELKRGLSSQDSRGNSPNCYWMQREIEDLESGVIAGDVAIKDYVDITPLTSAIDKGLQKSLANLRMAELTKKLSFRNIRRYTVAWAPTGIDPSTIRAHGVYCDRFVKDFYEILVANLSTFFAGEQKSKPRNESKLQLINEIKYHIAFCQARASKMLGRKPILQKIRDHILKNCKFPLLIHGQAGCGLTSIMAKAAVSFAPRDPSCSTLIRMIGVTGESFNARTLLRSLCLQMSHIFDQNPNRVPHDMKGLSNIFEFLCGFAHEDQEVVIFIDSLHKLSDEHEGKKLAWLPRNLPEYVHMVLSSQSAGQGSDCVKAFTQAYGDEMLLEVQALENIEASVMLAHWLEDAKRRLTMPQREVIMAAFAACQTPVFLRVLVNESFSWSSSYDPSGLKIGNAVKNVATVMMGRLEKEYGEAFTRRTLGYITASRKGLMIMELEDLISLDESAMDEIVAQNRIGIRRIPPVLLLRLYYSIMPHIQEVNADGHVTLMWKHSQVAEVAVERYMNARDKAPSYHKAMAEYFLNTWHDKLKPFSGNEKGSHRFVVAQPLFRTKTNPAGEVLGTTYNLRKLYELPYHLIKSQQHDVLKKSCLCNFEFVLAKISASGIQAVVDDLQLALSVEPADMDLKLLSDTLHLSSTALSKDPRQLASQIVGRLDTIIRMDKPVAPSDPVVYPALKSFYAQALRNSTPSLLPSAACLSQPGSILYDLLSGHTDGITAVVVSSNGQKVFTTSLDDTLKVWELRSGRVIKTIVGVGKHVLHIRLGLKATLVITSEINAIRVWDVEKGECVYQIDSDDPATVGTACGGSILVTFFHGCSRMKSWQLDSDFKELVDLDFELENPEEPAQGIHKDNSTLLAGNSNGDKVLHAFKDANYAMVRNVKSGEMIYKLNCKKASSIQALASSREHYICAVRFRFNISTETHQIEVFDNTNGQPYRVLAGCTLDHFSEIFVNNVGSHIIAISYSVSNQSSDIAGWNIETEEHKHLAKHAKVSKFGSCVDLRYILTASEAEPSLRIWNLSAKINQPCPREKPINGVETLVPMVDNPRYLVAKSFNNDPLTVWNITKKGFSGSAVYTERGLVEMSDIVLVRNNKLVILAEKGPSNVSKQGHVFKTIHVYDMVEKKYIQRLSGCYVFPSPMHEYVILHDEQLMGLSENRTHLVIWSLTTGHITHRIKPNFKADYVLPDKEPNNFRTRGTTAEMTPWQRRSESASARKRRHQKEIEDEKAKIEAMKKEKENSIEQYIISKDYSTIVTSYYAHHLCVFDIQSQTHTQTLESQTSMLFLHVSALTNNGSHLVHTNYDDESKASYVTLWDCGSGLIRKRLRNEKNVQAIAISDNAQRVVFGKRSQELRIWEPFEPNSLRKIKGYPSLNFGIGSVIHIVDNGSKAIVFAGDISLWDLANGVVLAVFTPDMRIQTLSVVMDGRLIVFGLKDTNKLVTLKMVYPGAPPIEKLGENIFNEEESSDEDDDFDEYYEDDKKEGEEEVEEEVDDA